ncbi:MAG TPA: PepSY-associated TM helix domain-containing protein [Pyrinomonadaceae bacterium]|nr:PepSY-associated TM helix domain-containing protein [Pyrinomonadaceae bacterium]
MKFNLLNRKIHYWLSIAVAIPILIVIASGILLQVKKQFSWIQPTEQRGKSKTAMISLAQVLEISKTVAEAEIETWEDIHRLDVRPSRGMLKVWAKNNWEIQIDTETGAILQTAYRRSDIIESFHDGSFFHDSVKMWIFLPSGIILLILWLTGMYLFILPIWVKRKRKIARE